MKQVEITTTAPSKIDMDLLQQLIADQKLATYEGPVQPTTFNYTPKATYHPRRCEPIKLDKITAELATFWALCAKPPPHTQKPSTPPKEPSREPSDQITLSSITQITKFTNQIQSLQAANSSQCTNIKLSPQTTSKLESEMIGLKAVIKRNQTETKNLQDAMTTLAASSTDLHASQTALTHTVNSSMNVMAVGMDEEISNLMEFLSESSSHKKQRITAPATHGTQDTMTPGTQEPILTDLSHTRESNVNMGEDAV